MPERIFPLLMKRMTLEAEKKRSPRSSGDAPHCSRFHETSDISCISAPRWRSIQLDLEVRLALLNLDLQRRLLRRAVFGIDLLEIGRRWSEGSFAEMHHVHR